MSRYIITLVTFAWDDALKSVTCVGQADTPEAAQQLASALHEESGNPYLRHFVVEVPESEMVRSLSAKLAAASECLGLAAEKHGFTPESVTAILGRLHAADVG